MTPRALLLAALLLLPRGALAADGRAMSLEEMVARSEEIVVGQVLEAKARWKGRLILTVTSVRVDEALKGSPPSRTLKITQLGGTAVHPRLGAPVTMTVSSYTALAPGERVVLFLDQQRPGLRQLVGAQQGKLVVREEPVTGEQRLPGAPRRLTVRHDRAAGPSIGAEPMTLETLRDRIRAIVAGEGGSR